MRTVFASIVLTTSLLTACSQSSPTAPQATILKDPAWTAALDTLYTTKPVFGGMEDGTKLYIACFAVVEDKCFRVQQDPFKRHRVFRLSSGTDILAPASLMAMIYLKDQELPVVLLHSQLLQKDWLYVKEFAVMADEKVVLTQKINSDGLRSAFSDKVLEQATFSATPEQLEILAGIKDTQTVIIRITGENGYETVPPNVAKIFIADVRRAKAAAEAMNKALAPT